jgi:hypothetical protein
MTVRDRKGRWLVAGVGAGVALFGVGLFLHSVGLEDADRWGSVFGVFLNVAGLAVGVCSAVWARRAAVPPASGAGGWAGPVPSPGSDREENGRSGRASKPGIADEPPQGIHKAYLATRAVLGNRLGLAALASILIAGAVVLMLAVGGPEKSNSPSVSGTPSQVVASADPGAESASTSPPTTGDVLSDAQEGVIDLPHDGADLQSCAYFTGTFRLPLGRTLILAKSNLTTGAKEKYVEYVFGWDQLSAAATWEGAQYFGEDNDSVGQQYLVELMSVDLVAARLADEAGTDAAANELADAGTVLDSVTVGRVRGQAPDDCPGR